MSTPGNQTFLKYRARGCNLKETKRIKFLPDAKVIMTCIAYLFIHFRGIFNLPSFNSNSSSSPTKRIQQALIYYSKKVRLSDVNSYKLNFKLRMNCSFRFLLGSCFNASALITRNRNSKRSFYYSYATMYNASGNSTPRRGEVLLYMGYIGMCGPKGYGFSARFGHK